MAKAGGAFVCLLIVVMDIVAGILGIEAEIAQNKVRHLRFMIFECKEPSNQAFLLGLAAAGLLAFAHVAATLLGGCMCICSTYEFQRSSSNKQLAAVCFVISWVIMAIGIGVLVIGAMANNRSRKCGLSHHSFLSIGGILCFVHGLFCVAYYVSATAATGEDDDKPSRRGSGAQMAERHHHGLHA
ncbi:DUF1218 domain-containing protein [Cinnamomum micranthum f. kanehirae]|uniref:DUF1218 domain-containing protein n=1 Tax=Cinnamomum micranthum f. kanehirae TaxID=337451 RepID=A0A443P0R5_9MAGN|nr:DUF1218 domain-containing protein [Cinnamomum micranthum f. kanehirae]